MKHFHLSQFDGPLLLLLSLIEEKKLEITEIALAEVTDQYLAFLAQEENHLLPEELADFLVIATRLLLMKSRSILPVFSEDEDEGNLAQELRLYKIFLDASKVLEKIASSGTKFFSRESFFVRREIIFSPPNGLCTKDLRDSFENILKNLEPFRALPEKIYRRVMSLEEKVIQIRGFLENQKCCFFSKFFSDSYSRGEIVVSFLALLELLKQGEVRVEQQTHFMEIEIVRA